MNSTTIDGQGQELGGIVKEVAGKLTGDQTLQNQGVADQITGSAKQFAGAAREAIANPGPLADKAKAFAREKPFATAALAGVVGLALFNTLRGK